MKSIRVIISIWVAWVFIVIGFQALATARMSVQYPDRAQDRTARFTGEGYQEGHVFLLEPFMDNIEYSHNGPECNSIRVQHVGRLVHVILVYNG